MSTRDLLSKAAKQALSHRAFEVMDDIEYRPVRNSEDLEQVVALRKKCYTHHDIFAQKTSEFQNDADVDPKNHVIGIHYQEALVASVRIELLHASNRDTNCMHYFPEILEPLVDQGLRFVDPTRFSIAPGISQFIPSMPYIVLRLVFMATVYYGYDFSLCMLRSAHRGFYSRVFLASQISPLKTFDFFNDPYALYTTALKSEAQICQNYPLFLSTKTERNLLFEPSLAGNPQTLSVRPTSRIAQKLGTGLLRGTA